MKQEDFQMIEYTQQQLKEWSDKGPKFAFGDTMIEIGAQNKDVVVVGADLSKSLDVLKYGDAYPDRFFNLGICEQNMIGVACGLAKEGKIPVAATFATFASMRSCEQIRSGMGYMKMNVKVVGGYAGVMLGTLGNSHYAIEDIAIMRDIPNITVVSPADGLSISLATKAMIDYPGPVYMRLAGTGGLKMIYDKPFDFQIGKAIKLKEGEDVAIIATGTMVAEALEAAEALAAKGITATVLDMHTIKPLDTEAIAAAAKGAKLVVTVEEHSIIGGLGGAVAEYMAQAGGMPRLKILGLPDRFHKIAVYREQLERCGITGPQIADTILAELEK